MRGRRDRLTGIGRGVPLSNIAAEATAAGQQGAGTTRRSRNGTARSDSALDCSTPPRLPRHTGPPIHGPNYSREASKFGLESGGA